MKHNRSLTPFIIVWLGQLISNIGSGLTAFALGMYVYQKTGSTTQYSFIILAAFLPSLLLKPMGGTLSDRMDRRLLMIIGDVGTALGLLFIIMMLQNGLSYLWIIYFGTIVSSSFTALQNPAYKASITDLVHPELYTKASGLMQLAESSKYLLSPVIAGIMMKFLNIQTILTIDFFTFIIAIITIFWVKSGHKKINSDVEKKHFMLDLQSGFQYLFANTGILLLLSITSLITFFIGFLQVLLGPMVLAFADAQAFGISQSISTTGMLFGSVVIGLFGKNTSKINLLSMGLILCGIFFSLMGVAQNLILITLFGFFFFLVLPFVNTSLDVLVRTNVENEMQGRIWSIVSLISQLGMAVAFSIAGYVADKIFNPLLKSDGLLASSVGSLIGTGEGRGIGLIFIISGFFVLIIAIMIRKLKILKDLECTQMEMA